MVASDPPLLVTVSESVPLVPTCTLPKPRLGGFGDRVPGKTAVPVTGIVSVGFEALLMTATLPVTVPAVCGANTTLKLAP